MTPHVNLYAALLLCVALWVNGFTFGKWYQESRDRRTRG